MKMFTIGDTTFRLSDIFMIVRPYEKGRYGIRTYIKGLNVAVDAWYKDQRERDNVHDAMIDAIEEE